RTHNSENNTGWTRGRRWHLLAVIQFPTRTEAFEYETKLKKSLLLKSQWKAKCIQRADRIRFRHGYSFEPRQWGRDFHKHLERYGGKMALELVVSRDKVVRRSGPK